MRTQSVKEPQRGDTTLEKTNARVIVPLLFGAHSTFVRVYPGLHFGLCPHYTLGYAGVSPLQGSSTSSLSLYYFNAVTLT